MNKKITKIALLALMGLGLVACGNPAKEAEKPAGETGELYISAAASLQDALNEVTENFNKDNKVDFKLNYGGSGALQTQIEEGADADIFMSASSKQMDALIKEGLIDEKDKVDLLLNDVVLITEKGNKKDIKSIEELATDKVSLVALGDPESVPVGQYSQEILNFYKIADEVNAKTTYASDVRQVLNWVSTGEADAGFVYKTDAMLKDANVDIIESAAKDSHKKVIYPVASLKDSKNKELAKKFLDYLKSEDAMKVFAKYGFGKVEAWAHY